MSNTIQQTIADAWQRMGARSSPNGWASANAVCCHHNGHKPDRRRRGGIITGADGSVSYSCFNCGFRAHYRPGWALSYKVRKLLSWLGIDEGQIRFLVLEAIRLKEFADDQTVKPEREIKFNPGSLPEGSQSFAALAEFYALKDLNDCPEKFLDAVNYVSDRQIDMTQYQFYYTDSVEMRNRVIVPFMHENQVVGYTARSFDSRIHPKYIMASQPGYVFNIDQQQRNWRTVVVCEGIFDAMSIDGVAVMHNEINEMQADQIDELGRDIIVVPDWDTAGRKLVDQAVEYNWAVSFPVWNETCKDINEAVCKYGKLFVLKTILDSAEHSSLKIQLWAKRTRWMNA